MSIVQLLTVLMIVSVAIAALATLCSVALVVIDHYIRNKISSGQRPERIIKLLHWQPKAVE